MVREVYVIGLGMGNPDTLTIAAQRALQECKLVIGSRRLLDALEPLHLQAQQRALVDPAHIERELRDASTQTACVIMSGDVGFYSGATRLYEHLAGMNTHVVPGVSSLSYLCARLRMPWQSVHVVSAHGRAHNVAGAVQCHRTTFVLAGSGAASARGICTMLCKRDLGHVMAHVGERLSYDDERITYGRVADLAQREFDPLSVLLIHNELPLSPTPHAPHLADSAFVRGKVPMTKEEVRELALCKLRIDSCSVVWDVGAGTGSVSVEAARLANQGQVFAVEQSAEACGLIRRNKDAFNLTNLCVVEGRAPEALVGLPVPDRLFLGGSGHELTAIVEAAIGVNPGLRLCMVAVTLETLAEAVSCIQKLGLANVDICEVSIAKAHRMGAYNLMRAHNPVYLLCASGPSCNEEA